MCYYRRICICELILFFSNNDVGGFVCVCVCVQDDGMGCDVVCCSCFI